jgi:hypothetical protein
METKMKKNLLIVVCLVLGLGWATAGTSAQKTVTYPAVPLKVTIENLDSANTRSQIRSDENGEYIDGMAGIEANIDQYGNLIIDFQTGRAAQRLVYFDYSRPYSQLPPGAHVPPYPTGLQGDSYLSTIPKDNSAYTPLQNLGIDSSECVSLGWSFTWQDAKKTQWRNDFHRGQQFPAQANQTSYAVVTRIDLDTWEVEPKSNSCNTGMPTVVELLDTPTKGSFNFTDDGLYYMPFKLTLRRK